MSDSFDERRRAQEEGYFDKLNQDALARLASKKTQPAKNSPVTGKPMELVTVMGVVLDRCHDSGGLWFDVGELEHLLEITKNTPQALEELLALSAMQVAAQGVQASKGATGSSGTCLSPINSKPMNHDKVLGVSLFRCPESGGVWIEPLELRNLFSATNQSLVSGIKSFLTQVLGR